MLGTRPYVLELLPDDSCRQATVSATDPRWWGVTDALVSSLGGRWREAEGSLVLELGGHGDSDHTALIGLGVCLWHMGREVVLDTGHLETAASGVLDLIASLVQYGLVVTIRHPSALMSHELSLHGLCGVPDERGTELRVVRAAAPIERRPSLRLVKTTPLAL